MSSKTFEGRDKDDLDTQIWNWKSENSKIKELKRHPVETLPLTMNKVTPGAKISPPNSVSIRIDYEEQK